MVYGVGARNSEIEGISWGSESKLFWDIDEAT